jgi:hypothetical protein
VSTVAIGTIAAGALGAGASIYGSTEQAGAAESAQQLQAQEAQNALNFQQQEWNTQQANQAPFLKAGQTAIGDLSGLLAPGGALSQQWTGQFAAPTAAQAQATPGYQFTLQQGQNAIQNSAAAQGNLLSGGTEAALDQYGQGLASNTYQQSFNNALTQYQQSYNQFQQGQANQFNRLASVAGLGQTSAGQLGQEGQAAASNSGNIDLTTGAQQGQDIQNAAYYNASGYANAANSLGTGIQALGLYGALGGSNSSGMANISGGDYGLTEQELEQSANDFS